MGGAAFGDMFFVVDHWSVAPKRGPVAAETGARSVARITDGGGHSAVKDVTLAEAGRERAVDTAAVVLCLFGLLPRY